MNTVKSRSISPAALADMLSAGTPLELIDVRTPLEYGIVHVPGAKLNPLSELDVRSLLAQHKPGTPIYVLCQAGARAAVAIEHFERAGCKDCVLVNGGTQAWVDAGLPVHRLERAGLPLMRQVQLVIGSLAVVGSLLSLTINRWFVLLPLFLGCGLLIAGSTGTCGLALLLAKMPWNRGEYGCQHCNSVEQNYENWT